MAEEKITSTLRLRMSAKDAHYGGELVDGAHMVHLFGDVATELLIKCDGDEGLFCAYDNVEFKHHDVFNVDYPTSCPNVPDEMLDAKGMWSDKVAYDEAANKLAQMFADNFASKYPNMPSEIVNAGPKPRQYAIN